MNTNQKLLILNNVSFHYEIIESVIVKYHEILNINSNKLMDIYLHVSNDYSFQEYIKNLKKKKIFSLKELRLNRNLTI